MRAESDRYDAVTIAAVADDEDTFAPAAATGASAKRSTSRYDGTALIAAAHLGHDGVVRQLARRRRAAGPREQPAPDGADRGHRAGNGGAATRPPCALLAAAGADTRLTDRQGAAELQLARARGYDGDGADAGAAPGRSAPELAVRPDDRQVGVVQPGVVVG